MAPIANGQEIEGNCKGGWSLTVTGRALCIVPARGGSKEIPRKNLALLGARSLLDWTLDSLQSALYPVRVIVSTDDESIADVAQKRDVEVRIRPEELASDFATTESVIQDVVQYVVGAREAENLLLAQVTSPFRRSGSIDGILRTLEDSGADSAVSVVPQSPFLWVAKSGGPKALYDPRSRPRRQDLNQANTIYRESGSLYAFSRAGFERFGCRIFGRVQLFLMSDLEGLDIDTQADLDFAQFALDSGLWRQTTVG